MYSALGLRQLGAAAVHCKLDPRVINFMKLLCSQEIYRLSSFPFIYEWLQLGILVLVNRMIVVAGMLCWNLLWITQKFPLELSLTST